MLPYYLKKLINGCVDGSDILFCKNCVMVVTIKYFAVLFYIVVILIKSTFKKKCKTGNICRM